MTPAARLRAVRLVARAVCAGPPDRPAATWRDAAAVALAEGLGGALWAAVRDLPAGTVPPAAAAALRAAHRATLGRNLLVRRQLDDVLDALVAAGVEPVPLKGALYLFDGTLPELGVRETGDLDVAVSPEAFERSVAALCRAGYRLAPGRPFAHPHELPLKGGVATLELHVSLGSPPIPAVVPLDAAVARAERRGRWVRLWPTDVARNLSFAFGRAYLDDRYHHGDRPLRLALARCRHAVHLAAHGPRRALRSTLVRRR